MVFRRISRVIGFSATILMLSSPSVNANEGVMLNSVPIEVINVLAEPVSSWDNINFDEYANRDRYVEESIEVDKIYDVPLDADLQYYLKSKCNEMGVDFVEALAVMETESYYDIKLIHTNPNGTKDYGLMQINTIHHAWLTNDLGVTDFLDPYQNIDCGVYLLSRRQDVGLHERLMSYNMGSPRTKQLISQGITTSKYSRKIEGIMDRLNNEGNVRY